MPTFQPPRWLAPGIALAAGGLASTMAMITGARTFSRRAGSAADGVEANRVFSKALSALDRVAEHLPTTEAVERLRTELTALVQWGWVVEQKHSGEQCFYFSDIDHVQQIANTASRTCTQLCKSSHDPEHMHLIADLDAQCSTIQAEIGRLTKAIEGRLSNRVCRAFAGNRSLDQRVDELHLPSGGGATDANGVSIA